MDCFILAAETSQLAGWLDSARIALVVCFAVGLVIFVHELGHFLVAKACGVRCDKFYVGFDPPPGKFIAWMFGLKEEFKPFGITLPSRFFRFKWGETEYGVGIIPLGGYVKMFGQDDNPNNAAKEAEATQTAEGKLDPRSYMAKSVPQRMAIISAGVVFNLISAVVFGAIAYSLGVKYEPCIVSGTNPGSSAWKSGEFLPGDRILQLGKGGTPNEHLRFSKDLMPYVFLHGKDRPVDLLVQRGDADPRWVSIMAEYNADIDMPLLGVEMPLSTRIPEDATFAHLAAGKAQPAFEKGDRIVAIDGTPVEDYYDFRAHLARNLDKPVTVTVSRGEPAPGEKEEKSPEQVEIRMEAQPMRTLGAVMEAGEITAVRDGSPAHAAGLRSGDTILSVEGEPLGDAFTLEQRLIARIGEPTKFTILPGGPNAVEKEVTITPEAPLAYSEPGGAKGPLGIETIGVAIRVTSKIAAVEPDSPAAAAGLQPGDEILSAKFEPAGEEQAKLEKRFVGKRGNEEMKLTKVGDTEPDVAWPMVHNAMQIRLPDTKLHLTYSRKGDSSTKSVVLQSAASDQWFSPIRGLKPAAQEEVHTASGFGEAWALGLRETKEAVLQVVTVLGKLVTGQLSPTKLGGPGQIFYVAGAEASHGWARLLIFLTLFSGNLAVINFLPIPVLDGGHMVFLAIEGIRGKPVDPEMQGTIMMVGLAFILCLMVFVISMDISTFYTLWSR